MNKYQAFTAKARQLQALQKTAGEHVPSFFVTRLDGSDADIIEQIQSEFSQPTKLIFRTSAKGEDGQVRSAAGLFESVPNVDSEDQAAIDKALSICRKSLHSARVREYLGRIISPKDAELIVQSYISADISGVAFVYPNDRSASLLSFGGAEAVTSGEAALATLSFNDFLQTGLLSLTLETRQELLDLLDRLAKELASPTDFEWLIANDKVYIVQARPITADPLASTFGEIVFDSTNIGENYPGTTAPLTYSFVRSAYSAVYPNFLRILQTSDAVLAANTFATANLVAYVEGRIYYNLENWYRLLKLLPFYRYLKTFFNRMLSPVKSVDSADNELPQVSFRTTILFTWYMLFPLLRTRRFEKQFPQLFSHFTPESWQKLPTAELLLRFESLRDSFFRLWANTIINDFHVMVFWGLLVALAHKTCVQPSLFLNSAIDASHFPASLEPLHALEKLADLISKNQEYRRLFSSKPEKILATISKKEPADPLRLQFETYLQSYGDRSGQELKIEVPKFSEQPEEVIRLLQEYVKATVETTVSKKSQTQAKMEIRRPLLIPVVKLTKHIAVAGIYRREKYRMMRGKAFGIARSVFLEMGTRLAKLQLLNKPSDVFLLTYEELSSLVLFHTLPIDPTLLVTTRQQQLNEFHGRKPNTRVLTYNWNTAQNQLIHDDHSMSNNLSGTGTSITPPVTGEVLVMEEFTVDAAVAGKILVTKKTDPGWTVLFPLIKGVVTETGSTLSHASIIARELGIPCITGVRGCTTTLRDGEQVQLIPETGEVRRINT